MKMKRKSTVTNVLYYQDLGAKPQSSRLAAGRPSPNVWFMVEE